MRIPCTFTLEIDVHDKEALFQAAYASALKSGIGERQAIEWLMTDGEIDIASCLVEILDPGISPDGTCIQDSDAQVYDHLVDEESDE